MFSQVHAEGVQTRMVLPISLIVSGRSCAQISAAAFGLAHLSLRDLPQLVALGCLLGVTYTRSRNLLTPMLIHGAWNGTVLTILYLLVSNGIDVQKMLAT